jgi:branched-chain amino acid transport system permease protein
MVLVGVFCVLWLVVVAVRRSTFGERLLAMKDSPAACVTLGLDLTATKFAVFGLSAAIAGIGGALYAGALASVSPDNFAFFSSLPVLLLAVVGGIASPIGSLLGAGTLYLIPVIPATITWLAGPSAVLPGLIGISLGRNPNGVAADLGERLAPLRGSLPADAALGGIFVVLIGLYQGGLIGGWLLGALLFLAPFLVARVVERGAAAFQPGGAVDESVEWLGLDEPLTTESMDRLDRALALPEVGR